MGFTLFFIKMARTREQIQDDMIANVQSDLVLSEKLTSTSVVAIWRLWTYIFSKSLFEHELIVEENAKKSRVHTLSWYKDQALLFADGLDLIWNNGQFEYPEADDLETRQIVKKCAVLENNDGQLVIKITGENNELLDDDQALRFTAYMNEIKDAGNRLKIVNRPADELILHVDVYVDALQIDLNTGKLLSLEQDFKPVQTAIKNYLNNLEFNGALYYQKLEREILSAQGVEDIEITKLQHRYGAIPFANVGRYVVPDAGHFTFTEIKLNYYSNVV